MSSLSWTYELEYWMVARGHKCDILAHKFHTNEYAPDVANHEEWGTVKIDGIEYPFHVERYTYGNALVRFVGIPGDCSCPDQQASVILQDGTCVSERHPGLKWLYEGRYIDADKMERLWRSGVAFPFDLPGIVDHVFMPCYDKDGNEADFGCCGTNDVETSSVLDHIYPHIRQVKLKALRTKAMVKRIQRAWLQASYNPETIVGKRVMHSRAIEMAGFWALNGH